MKRGYKYLVQALRAHREIEKCAFGVVDFICGRYNNGELNIEFFQNVQQDLVWQRLNWRHLVEELVEMILLPS